VLNPATGFILRFSVCAFLLLTAVDSPSRWMWPPHGAMEPHTPFLRDNLGAFSQSSATPILTQVFVLICNAPMEQFTECAAIKCRSAIYFGILKICNMNLKATTRWYSLIVRLYETMGDMTL
jgi:hypothetical protein